MARFWREFARLITLFDGCSPEDFLESEIGEFSRKSFRIGLEMSRGLTRTVIRYPTRKTNAGVSYWNLYFAR